MKIKITAAVIVVSIIVIAFWFWPFSDAFTKDYDAVIDEMVRIIDENPTAAGVDKASNYFTDSQSRLRGEMDFGLSQRADLSENYLQCVYRNRRKLDKLADKHPELKNSIEILERHARHTNGSKIYL